MPIARLCEMIHRSYIAYILGLGMHNKALSLAEFVKKVESSEIPSSEYHSFDDHKLWRHNRTLMIP